MDRRSKANVGIDLMHNRIHERQSYYTYKRNASVAAGAFLDIYVFTKLNDFHLRAVAKSAAKMDLVVEKAADITDVAGDGAKRSTRLFYGHFEVQDDIITEFYDAVTGGTPAFEEVFVDPSLGDAPGSQTVASSGGDIVELAIEQNQIYRVRVKNTDVSAQEAFLLLYGYPVPRDPGLDQYFPTDGGEL